MKKYYGEQTELALKHFKIGTVFWPKEMIHAQAQIKYSAAIANAERGALPLNISKAIQKASLEVMDGKHDEQFPLMIWQSGSGTQFNMNVNEVIASRANEILTGKISGKSPIHPNDHVNRSQSTNDTVPTAMHIASYVLFREQLEPVLNNFSATLARKVKAFKGVQKVGRTHLQDAVSITLGEEFSGYRAQIDFARQALHEVFAHILEVPIGGTAVGTGLNAPRGFSTRVTKVLANKTGYKFKPSRNSFESMAQHSRLVMVSGTLKVLAVVLMKIANDIRFLGSGPRAGLGELVLPANEPGSSIMPGKVNPTQCEALMMVCAKVIGNDAAIVVGEMSLSNFELEVAKPLLASTIIESVHLLTDAISSFDEHCVRGLKINGKRLKEYEGMSLTEATVMSKDSGYEKVAGMVKQSLKDERN